MNVHVFFTCFRSGSYKNKQSSDLYDRLQCACPAPGCHSLATGLHAFSFIFLVNLKPSETVGFRGKAPSI